MITRFFKWLFPEPKVGSIWTLQPQNPFEPLIRKEIIEVKNGWVRMKDLNDGDLHDANIGLLRKVFKEEKK
jgi:hypothetical protein